SNKFKEITVQAYIEAMMNIMISVALVKWIGLIGVTIGTIVGMTYRMVFHVYYTSKIVPGRPQCIFYRK
ncbi:polysaccharide biosynthesis C-terminal domain-containing protein, partial [Faecalibacterium prausnitzii]